MRRLTLTLTAIGVLVFLFWGFWVHLIPVKISQLSHALLAFTQNHPHLLRAISVCLNAIPDFAFTLLALAGLSYLMPELTKKLDKSKTLRISVAFVFVLFGFLAIVVNALNRTDQENKWDAQGKKMDSVRDSVSKVQDFLIASKGQVPNEAARRKQVLDALRAEYILSHDDVPAAMIAGNSYPPSDWTNKRLRDLGERWEITQPTGPTTSGALSEKARLEVSFWPSTITQWPIHEKSLPQVNGIVTVNFTFMAKDHMSKQTKIWLRLCKGCKYAHDPTGFSNLGSHPGEDDDPHERVLVVGDLLPNVAYAPIISVDVIPPINQKFFLMGVLFGCENCDPVDADKPQILHVDIQP